MRLSRRLRKDHHVHRFTVTPDELGWEVREEKDAAVVNRVHRDDWHRVERDAHLFELKVLDLKGDGWIER